MGLPLSQMYSINKTHPVLKIVSGSLIELPTPANISAMWNIGSLLGLCLGVQMLLWPSKGLVTFVEMLIMVGCCEYFMQMAQDSFSFAFIYILAEASIMGLICLSLLEWLGS